MIDETKNELYQLVDALPENEALVAKRFLEFLLSKSEDPVLRAFLNAPEDDEPMGEQELKNLEEAQEAISAGRVTPWEEVKKEFGL